MLDAINQVLGEPDSVYVIAMPKRTEGVDSRVEASLQGATYRLRGHTYFDVLFAQADPGSGEIAAAIARRLGGHLQAMLRAMVAELGWDVSQLSEPRMAAVIHTLYGLPLNYGSKAIPDAPIIDTVDLKVLGPLLWVRQPELPWLFESPLQAAKGVYLWTVPVGSVEFVYYVGQTGRSFGQRQSEHLEKYLSGQYSVVEAAELAQGRQKLLWSPGTGGYGPSVTEYLDRLPSLASGIVALLKLIRCHVVPIDDERVRSRVEGALGRHFQNHEDAQVRGTFGVGARFPAPIPGEDRVRCRFSTEGNIKGFPNELIV